MLKRAYYKENDKEGSIFIQNIDKNTFEALCGLLEVKISSVEGLESLSMETAPEMPQDYEAEGEENALPFNDLPAEEKSTPAKVQEEEVKSEVTEQPALVDISEDNKVADTTVDMNVPESIIEDSGKKYFFSILKVGEKAITGGPAKAISELKAYCKGVNIPLIQDGTTFYVSTAKDKLELEKAYQFIRES